MKNARVNPPKCLGAAALSAAFLVGGSTDADSTTFNRHVIHYVRTTFCTGEFQWGAGIGSTYKYVENRIGGGSGNGSLYNAGHKIRSLSADRADIYIYSSHEWQLVGSIIVNVIQRAIEVKDRYEGAIRFKLDGSRSPSVWTLANAIMRRDLKGPFGGLTPPAFPFPLPYDSAKCRPGVAQGITVFDTK